MTLIYIKIVYKKLFTLCKTLYKELQFQSEKKKEKIKIILFIKLERESM